MEPSDQIVRARSAGRPGLSAACMLVWGALAVVSSLYVTIPLTPLFADRFGVPLHAAAWPGSAFSLAYAIGLPIWGALSDRYGRKPVIATGLLALAAVSPLIGLADSLPLIAALRAAQGLAASSFAPAALAYAAEMYPPRRSVVVIGLITTGFMSAGVLGQLFAAAVERHWGWPPVFYALGAIYALSAVWLGGGLPGGGAARGDERLAEKFRAFLFLLRQKKLPHCYFIAGTLLLAFTGMYAGIEAVLTRPPFALGPDQMLPVRAAGLPGVLLSPLAGRLAATKTIPAAIAAPSLAVAAGIALAIPPLIAIIGRLGGNARAAAVTLYTFILFIGATLGPPAALWSLQAAGRDGAAFALPAALLLAGWWLSRRIPAPDR